MHTTTSKQANKEAPRLRSCNFLLPWSLAALVALLLPPGACFIRRRLVTCHILAFPPQFPLRVSHMRRLLRVCAAHAAALSSIALAWFFGGAALVAVARLCGGRRFTRPTPPRPTDPKYRASTSPHVAASSSARARGSARDARLARRHAGGGGSSSRSLRPRAAVSAARQQGLGTTMQYPPASASSSSNRSHTF